MKIWHVSMILVCTFASISACDDKILPAGGEYVPTGEPVTYSNDIKEILDTHCITCHAVTKAPGTRNGAPVNVNLDTYDGAVDAGEHGNQRIQEGSMPPSGQLSGQEKGLFADWVDNGYEE